MTTWLIGHPGRARNEAVAAELVPLEVALVVLTPESPRVLIALVGLGMTWMLAFTLLGAVKGQRAAHGLGG